MTLDDHLDAGWQKLDQGDAQAARHEADRALALDERSAEAHTLAGAVSNAEGDRARALVELKRAMKLDDEAFEPALLAAEVYAAGGDLEDALLLAADALDRAEEEEDFLAALLLKAELELELDDSDAAAETLAELPPADVALPEAAWHVRAGACLLDIDDLDGAEAHTRAALATDPDSADALHLLGLIAEARGDDAERLRSFRRVRELDLKAAPSENRLPIDRIEELATAALAELPARARELLKNVPIVIEDYPSAELVDDGLDPRALGVFAGVPLPEQSSLGAPPHLECIQLFQRNLERTVETPEEIEGEIRTTVLHETGHFFGLDEEELEKLGLD